MQTKLRALSTKILDFSGRTVHFELKSNSRCFNEVSDRSVELYANGQRIGKMGYTFWKDALYINQMHNFTIDSNNPIKHIGSLFLEYAFRESLKEGKGGRIELNAIGKTPTLYFKWGFVKNSEPFNWMKRCILDYQNAEDQTKDLEEQRLYTHHYFSSLCDIAVENSGKNLSELSLAEIIEYGRIDPYNQEFKKILDEYSFEEGIPLDEKMVSSMTGFMYLPDESIKALKEQFKIYNHSKTQAAFFSDNKNQDRVDRMPLNFNQQIDSKEDYSFCQLRKE